MCETMLICFTADYGWSSVGLISSMNAFEREEEFSNGFNQRINQRPNQN